MVRKLILTREDAADRVIEALNATKESALTVVAPRGSALADREGLARIGELAAERGVAVSVESVDEELLALAHAAHLETVHPFFRADRRHLSLDGIVKNDVQHPRVPVRPEAAAPAPAVEESRRVEITNDDHARHPIAPHDHPLPTPVAARPSASAARPRAESEAKPRRRTGWAKIAVAALVLAAVVVGAGEAFFRRGTVSVTLAATPFEWSGTVVAATSVTTSTGNALSIPGQLFESPQTNVAQQFPATGEPGATSTPSAAKPRVTVYNESLDAETFVVRTRFQGKAGVFRAATAVAIPAAKKQGDQLVPGSATVDVVPDSADVLAGSADGERLSVPGLAGSPKAALFYGTLAKPAETTTPAQSTTPPAQRVVTAEDEQSATSRINDILANSFKAKLIASQPAGLTLIDGAIQVTPQQLTVNKDVDESGNFNLVGQATLRGLAFREDDLRALLLGQAVSQQGIAYPAEFRSADISYSNVQADLANGRLTFTVTVKGTVVGKTSEDDVRAQAAGKSRAEVADWIASQQMFEGGSVSVSPFWRFGMPADPAKVRVEIK